MADVAVGVEAALLREEQGRDSWQPVTLPLVLMLLARARCLLEGTPEGRRGLHGSHDGLEGNPEDSKGSVWCGVAIAWHSVGGGVPRLGMDDVEVVHFPDLCSDERWLHTQHGTLHYPYSNSGETRTVQLDAKFDSEG